VTPIPLKDGISAFNQMQKILIKEIEVDSISFESHLPQERMRRALLDRRKDNRSDSTCWFYYVMS